MCGFVAYIDLAGNVSSDIRIRRMTDAIRHRGPDDFGYFRQGGVGFGFRRLSIQDLSEHGHQPMSLPDAGVTIVFNGEIYNFIEIRRELEGRGRKFRSMGDTEVLLQAYLEWGIDCLSRLNGMWAFVIYDARRRMLVGARDRFGIKPLYHFGNGSVVALCSEIKSIRAVEEFQLTENWQVASSFLIDGRLEESGETFYREIRQIRAGHAFELSLDGELREWKYWAPGTSKVTASDDPAGGFADLFEDAVRLHMRSDVPVGVHLSGGLDSTSIICAAARVRGLDQSPEALTAFSFGTPEFDESIYIDDTLRFTGARFVPLEEFDGGLWESIQQCLWHQDEPVHTMIAVIGFLLMKLTAKHGIKVILNGQGADETLAGYPSYFQDYWQMLASRGRWVKAWRQIRDYSEVHGGSTTTRMLSQIQRVALLQARIIPGYREAVARRRRAALQCHPWFTPELVSRLEGGCSLAAADSLHESLSRSVSISPLPLYLRVEDRNSMAHSVEARVPFLDHRLVSFAQGLAPEWLLRGPWNKFVLRESMRGRIPESVRTRPDKMGFPFPTRRWLPGVLYEPFMDTLTSSAAKARGIYKLEAIERDMARHVAGEIDVMNRLFDVVQFELHHDMRRLDYRFGPVGGEATG